MPKYHTTTRVNEWTKEARQARLERIAASLTESKETLSATPNPELHRLTT